MGFRHIYRDLLKNGGFEVLEAEDGEKGWEMIKNNRPDLVLLDLVLPKITGFGVLQKIRQDTETKTLPVLIFSVLGEEDDVAKGLELGANGYMVKGSNEPQEIIGRINSLLSLN